MKIYKPKTIKEAIDDLQTFLECDLYSKFRPEQIIPLIVKGKKKNVSFYREDIFMNEGEFIRYLNGQFDILRKQIRSLKTKTKKGK